MIVDMPEFVRKFIRDFWLNDWSWDPTNFTIDISS